VLDSPESFPSHLSDLVPKVVPWDSDEGPGADPRIPEPLGGKLVWIRFAALTGGFLWYKGWAYQCERGRWDCTITIDGLVVHCFDRSARAEWLPKPYPADVFPLGYTQTHLAAWRWYVLGRMPREVSRDPDGISPIDSVSGPEVLLLATRCLAHHLGVISQDRLASPIPDTPGGIRREVAPLLDAMVARASETGGTPQETDPNRTTLETRIALALVNGDGTATRIAAVVSKAGLTVNAKMAAIYAIDNRALAWTSTRWAEVLGDVSTATIRQQIWWTEDRPKLRKK
jgi:hypothetical protein